MQTKIYLELPTIHDEKFPPTTFLVIYLPEAFVNLSFPHFPSYLKGSLFMVRRIFWQVVLKKAQKFGNRGENGKGKKCFPFSIISYIIINEAGWISHCKVLWQEKQEWGNPSIWSTQHVSEKSLGHSKLVSLQN